MLHNRSLCRALPALLLLVALILTSLPLHAREPRRPAPAIWKVAILGEQALSWIRSLFSPEQDSSRKEGMSIDPNGQEAGDGEQGDEGILIDPNG